MICLLLVFVIVAISILLMADPESWAAESCEWFDDDEHIVEKKTVRNSESAFTGFRNTHDDNENIPVVSRSAAFTMPISDGQDDEPVQLSSFSHFVNR